MIFDHSSRLSTRINSDSMWLACWLNDFTDQGVMWVCDCYSAEQEIMCCYGTPISLWLQKLVSGSFFETLLTSRVWLSLSNGHQYHKHYVMGLCETWYEFHAVRDFRVLLRFHSHSSAIKRLWHHEVGRSNTSSIQCRIFCTQNNLHKTECEWTEIFLYRKILVVLRV